MWMPVEAYPMAEYGPFGDVIRSTGPIAKVNPFRFSTKYDDDESDLLYYGYCYYKPSTGTWVSRDPKKERGGLNLYGFVHEDPLDLIDAIGLDATSTVVGKLADVYNEIRPSTVAGTTELYKAIYYYYSVLAPKINYAYAQLPPGTGAQYDDDTHTIEFDNSGLVSNDTVVHEMTHDCNYYWVKSAWQNLWMSLGIIPSSGWGAGQYRTWHGWVQFNVDKDDINNVKQALTVHLSCKQVSEAINAILAKKGCNFAVICSGQCSRGNSGGTIAPLNPIMPIFQ